MTMTPHQQKAFAQREGEDAYSFVARTIRDLRFKDLPQLVMLRNKDRSQVEAIQLYTQLRMVQWTRALAWATMLLGACTIIAAIILSWG